MTNAEAFLVEDLHLLLYISECKNNFQNPTLSDGLYLYVRKNNAPHMPYSTDTFGKELIMQLRAPLLLLAPRLACFWCVVNTLDVQKLSCMLQKRRETTTACVCDLALEHLGEQQLFVRPLFQFSHTLCSRPVLCKTFICFLIDCLAVRTVSINGPKGFFPHVNHTFGLIWNIRRSIENTCNLLR